MDTGNLATFYRNLEEILDLEPGTLKGGEALSDLESWDSVAALGFIGMAYEKYNVTIPAIHLPECKTVDNLSALITG
jgi:acyl carrier protein